VPPPLLASACTPFFGALVNAPAEIPAPNKNFASYAQQTPRWVPCGNGTECADVYAPLDWAGQDPEKAPERSAERITLRLAKHPAKNGDPIGTLFVNIGGPGASTVDAVRNWVDGLVSERLLQRYDVIGWDPRGVGASSAVACLDDAGMDDYLYGTGDAQADGADLEFGSDAWIRAGIASNAEFGAACLKKTGPLLRHVDTLSTVQDLEMLRAISGDEKLNYLGYSYGTRIGALYADRYPQRSGRLVLDGAMDPAASGAEISQQQVIGIEGALRAYVADCLTRAACPLGRGPGTSVDQGMQRIGDMLAKVRKSPIRAADKRMLYDSTLFTAIVAPLYAPQRWPELDKVLEDVSNGRASAAFQMADEYNDRVGGVYRSNLTEAFTAINCLDYPRPKKLDFDAMRAR
ncbi:MAG: alpha/beta fold hydrolase, partial [Actinobacteria bacterium]|nr:alpha/beta fold hydrolase [Actinomycetota bacterium]